MAAGRATRRARRWPKCDLGGGDASPPPAGRVVVLRAAAAHASTWRATPARRASARRAARSHGGHERRDRGLHLARRGGGRDDADEAAEHLVGVARRHVHLPCGGSAVEATAEGAVRAGGGAGAARRRGARSWWRGAARRRRLLLGTQRVERRHDGSTSRRARRAASSFGPTRQYACTAQRESCAAGAQAPRTRHAQGSRAQTDSARPLGRGAGDEAPDGARGRERRQTALERAGARVACVGAPAAVRRVTRQRRRLESDVRVSDDRVAPPSRRV